MILEKTFSIRLKPSEFKEFKKYCKKEKISLAGKIRLLINDFMLKGRQKIDIQEVI